MNAWIEFFFSLSGRIGREAWWLGQTAVLLAGMAVARLLAGFEAPVLRDSHAAATLLALALAWPAMALTIKRIRHEDNRPAFRAACVGVTFALFAAHAFALTRDPGAAGSGWIFACVAAAVGAWFVVDNGLRRSGASQPVAADIRAGAALLLTVVLAGLWGLSFADGEGSTRSAANRDVLAARQAERAALEAQRANDNEAVIRHLTRAIELHGEDSAAAAGAYRQRASARNRAKDRAGAIADLDRAIALQPGNAASYRGRASVLADMDRLAEALQDVETALAKDPDSAHAYVQRARLLDRLKRGEEAMASYTQAIAAARAQRARMPAQRDETALKRLRESRDRDLAFAYRARGNAYRLRGNPEAALADYAEALGVRPQDAQTYVDRGWLYEQQKQTALARADYEKAASLDFRSDWLKRALQRTK